jgi:hypothetical protein
MKDDIPKNLTENGYSSTNSDGSVDDLVTFARQHFETDFPNPERIDCPSSETYSDLIPRKRLPSEPLHKHLRSCSECFRIYRSLLDAQRTQMVLKPNWPTPLSWYKRVLSFGLPIILIGIAFYGFYSLYQTRRQGPGQGSASQQQQGTYPAQNNETSASTNQNGQPMVAERSKAPLEHLALPSRATVAVHTVVINFGRQRISRSASQSEIAPVRFVAGLNRVTVRLSAESPKGEYAVTLNDPFGKEVKRPVVGKFDGRVLRAELDLNSVTSGKYLICVARAAEVPDCLPAIVKTKTK